MATPIKIGAAGGEYMETVVVTAWHAAPGDQVQAGQVIAEVETAKAVTEVEAPCDGILGKIEAGEGTEVAVDATLGFILGEGEELPAAADNNGNVRTGAATKSTATPVPPAPVSSGRVVASPVARRLAHAAGLDLARIEGTGPRGRIKRRDVEKTLKSGGCDAAPVVLLHGFAADRTIWSALAAELRGSHRWLRPELPGHGTNAALPDGGFDALVAPVLVWFDEQEAPKVHLVGHSLGGAVALALAAQRPQRIASLTLIAPAGLGPEINGEILAGLCRATRPESLLPWLRRLVSDPVKIDDNYARAAMAGRDAHMRSAQSELADRLFPDGTQGVDLRRQLAEVEAPLRLIWGREDRLLPWQQALAAPAHAALHLLPGTGHMPHVEAPALVARILGEVLAAANASMGENR